MTDLHPPEEHQLLVFWVALVTIVVVARGLGALARRMGAQQERVFDHPEHGPLTVWRHVAPEDVAIERTMDLRHAGQGYQVTVAMPDGAIEGSQKCSGCAMPSASVPTPIFDPL